jgi:pyruvate kinase
VEAVSMMARILESAESAPRALQRGRTQAGPSGSEEDALAEAASHMAEETGARLIVAVTRSGFTARLISKHRPSIPIVAFAPQEAVRRRLSVLWGVRPERLPASTRLQRLLARAESALLRKGLARRGELVVVLTGYPMRRQGTTNLLKIHRIGGARG